MILYPRCRKLRIDECGEFTAHSARHAGMAAGKASGMNDDELCARSNMSSTTYKKYYHRQVRHKVSEPSVGLNFFSERVG